MGAKARCRLLDALRTTSTRHATQDPTPPPGHIRFSETPRAMPRANEMLSGKVAATPGSEWPVDKEWRHVLGTCYRWASQCVWCVGGGVSSPVWPATCFCLTSNSRHQPALRPVCGHCGVVNSHSVALHPTSRFHPSACHPTSAPNSQPLPPPATTTTHHHYHHPPTNAANTANTGQQNATTRAK